VQPVDIRHRVRVVLRPGHPANAGHSASPGHIPVQGSQWRGHSQERSGPPQWRNRSVVSTLLLVASR
jgi:hypothetical protein